MACWRTSIKDIGCEQYGFHWAKCVEILLNLQSADIAQGVDAMQPGTNRPAATKSGARSAAFAFQIEA